MAAADFDDFSIQLCELLNLELPSLTCDDEGRRAFTITHKGTEFSFIERRSHRSENMSMLVKFGAPPSDKAAEVMANLMNANFLMMQKGGGAFVQMPETGEIFLHRMTPLSQLHVPGVHTFLNKFSDHVARWSRDYFLDSAANASSGELRFARLA
ncbi:MAG: CesT family type III secretion system chaperone [Bdellovibrionales bacterium]|nr:CesT family type III secretion system chaperone [Ramlibacter sp.]